MILFLQLSGDVAPLLVGLLFEDNFKVVVFLLRPWSFIRHLFMDASYSKPIIDNNPLPIYSLDLILINSPQIHHSHPHKHETSKVSGLLFKTIKIRYEEKNHETENYLFRLLPSSQVWGSEENHHKLLKKRFWSSHKWDKLW